MALENHGSVKTVKHFAYVGTYARSGGGAGIYSCIFDPRTGGLSEPSPVAEASCPNYLAFHPEGKILYAVEDPPSRNAGAVCAFSICSDSGRLRRIGGASCRGRTPCHLAVDPAGGHILVSNYSSGDIAVIRLLPGGNLSDSATLTRHSGRGSNPDRQEGPHVHSVTFDRAGKYAFAADLGLDKIMVYELDGVGGGLVPNPRMPFAQIQPGSGPRHFAFHPSGGYGYLVNEMANTVTAFGYLPGEGILEHLQTASTLPENYASKTYCAEIVVHPSGRYLYASNRGHDSIAVFLIDGNSGLLELIAVQPCGGKWPRHFCIDPTGEWILVANEHSGQISVFGIDQESGRLAGPECAASVPSPACIRFSPL